MDSSDKAVNTRSNSRAVIMPPPTAETTVSKFTKGKGPITIEALTGIIKEQSLSFEKAISGLSDKIDGWKLDFMSKVTATESRITALEVKIDNNIKKFEARIDIAIKDLQHRSRLSNNLHMGALLKINDREQRNRCNSAKISFYLDLSKTASPSAFDVYSRIIRPSLEDAKLAGRLKWLPAQYEKIIEVGHVLPGRKGVAPSFQFCFISRAALHAFLDFKKPHLAELNTQNEAKEPTLKQAIENGTRRHCKAGIDLTSLNRDLMSFLYRQKGVGGVKMAGTRVMYARQGVKGWYHACNPFGRTLTECSTPPVDTYSTLRELIAPKPLPPFLCIIPKERNLLFEDEVEERIRVEEEARLLRESVDCPVERSGGEVATRESVDCPVEGSGGEVAARGVEVPVVTVNGAAMVEEEESPAVTEKEEESVTEVVRSSVTEEPAGIAASRADNIG
jgi:hypothetical protein